MANIFESAAVKSDFAAFQKELRKSNKFLFKIDEALAPVLRKYHRLLYVIGLLEFKLSEAWKEDHQRIYVNEVLSDLLSNTSLMLQGFHHVSQILTRRVIENFYHHVYYFEHSVEYTLLNLGQNEYVPIMSLRDYYNAHPTIRGLKDPNLPDLNSKIFNHYQVLCRTAHSKGSAFMSLAKNLGEIKASFDLRNQLEQTIETLQGMVYLLIRFHQELKFTIVEKNLISLSLPKPLRGTVLT